MPRRTSRPTPAFLLALVALVFSMAGTGYAASQISGNIVKKRTLPGNRVAVNALTGAEIKESTLGLVPRATAAFSADSAALADTATTAKSADKASTAETATTADKAKDADRLGGLAPTDYLKSAKTVRVVNADNIAVNNGAEETAFCNPGEVAISGGAGWYILGTQTTIGSATLSTLIPVTDAATGKQGFRGEGKNTSAVARDFKVFVTCLAG